MTDNINAPWSLHFDCDGTEDFGIIRDAECNEIVASHLPERQKGDGNVFWLPEKEGDLIPQAVYQMKLMATAPKLLDACKRTLRGLELMIEMDDPQALTQMEWEAEPLTLLREAINEAEGD